MALCASQQAGCGTPLLPLNTPGPQVVFEGQDALVVWRIATGIREIKRLDMPPNCAKQCIKIIQLALSDLAQFEAGNIASLGGLDKLQLAASKVVVAPVLGCPCWGANC